MKKYNEINDNFLNLIKIVKKLRDKDNGCLWCNSQTSESIAKYSIEEANEVVEAIDKGNSSEICEELGDLLFQVIFHSQIKSDEKEFDINDVIKSINKKMIRRNPHVFNNKNNKEYTLDANWGRVIMAIGKTEENINQNKIKVLFGNNTVCENGSISKKINIRKLNNYMKNRTIDINVNLNLGKFYHTVYGNDLTLEYLKINADYRS